MSRQFMIKSMAAVAAIGACAVAGPVASATVSQDVGVLPADLRSPDARDAAPVVQQRVGPLPADLRSPDARDAVPAAQKPVDVVSSDVRSPDAVAAASDPGVQTYATPTFVEVGSDTGFDWADAGIGAGGALTIAVIGGGGLLLVYRRRPSRSRVSPAAS
jgi:hypothetical protein